jgi:4-cresol dehydrogenase (hydroxylating)
MTLTAPALPDAVVAQLTAVVGADRLILDREGVDAFKDPYWSADDDTYAGSAVILPHTTAEVQEIVRIAGESGIPVWPHGQGKNLGYGGPSPRVRGSLQISFHQMTAVLEIDEELGFAVVEPGVTWFTLYDELERRGSKWAISVPDLGWGSIIGNSMDAGVTYMPTGEEFQAICGLEVVLADGSLLRTNHGAQPGSNVAHVYKRNLGPSLDPLFVQGSFGIVVNAGVWLNLKQEAYAPMVLTIMEDDDLEAAIDLIRNFRERNLLRGVQSLYPTIRAAVGIADDPTPPPRTQLTAEEVRAIGERTGMGAWSLRSALWGDRDEVELTLAKIQREWERLPSGRFQSRGIFAPDEYDRITFSGDRVLAGLPDLTLIENWPSFAGHIAFSPVVALTGTEVRKLVEITRERAFAAGLNFSAGIHAIGNRSAIFVIALQYDKTDPARVEFAFGFARRLVEELGALGYGEYRAHLDFMDAAQDQFSFGNHAYRRFVEAIKAAVDPKGIIMPGRHGIWPLGHSAR